jgi:hypothetical protein
VQREIIRIEPIPAANVVSIVYAAVFAVVSLLSLPFLVFVPLVDGRGNTADPTSMLVPILLYPVFGAVMGWVGTACMAWLYNLVAARIGGIRLDVLHSDR